MRRLAALARWRGHKRMTAAEKRAARYAAVKRFREKHPARLEEYAKRNEVNWRMRQREKCRDGMLNEQIFSGGLSIVTRDELRFPSYVVVRNGERIRERFS